MSTFTLYLVGLLVLVAGLAIAAILLNVPALWIGVGVLVLIGLGMLMGVGKTRTKDVSTDA